LARREAGETVAEIESLKRERRGRVWNDLSNSQKVLQKIKQLKNKVSGYNKLASRWDDLITLCQMGHRGKRRESPSRAGRGIRLLC
jgi:hypothetical protein